MFTAAATNQMTINAMVAVVIDEVLALARSLATPRHAPHSTNPIRTKIMVRMCPPRSSVYMSNSERWKAGVASGQIAGALAELTMG
jgi:hypothetical protein